MTYFKGKKCVYLVSFVSCYIELIGEMVFSLQCINTNLEMYSKVLLIPIGLQTHTHGEVYTIYFHTC